MSTTLTIATAALGAASSVAAASAANSNAKRGQKLATSAGEANKTLVDQSTQSRVTSLAQKYSAYNKAAVASAGVRGARGASSESLQRASLAAALLDQSNILAESEAQKVAIDANTTSTVNQYQSQKTSPFMAGIMGGLQGLQAGMSMSNSFKDAGWISSPTKKEGT